MQPTETTTCARRTVDCTGEAEQGLRELATDTEHRLCVRCAIDLYDALDINRRGGRVELFDLA